MLENALKNCSLKVKITVKGAIGAGVMLLAAFLPLALHAAFGAAAGGKSALYDRGTCGVRCGIGRVFPSDR